VRPRLVYFFDCQRSLAVDRGGTRRLCIGQRCADDQVELIPQRLPSYPYDGRHFKMAVRLLCARPSRRHFAAASETRGPPPIPSTQSRTTAKAGVAATTAPKPPAGSAVWGRPAAGASAPNPPLVVAAEPVRIVRLDVHSNKKTVIY
jgi:hypothetical protein